MTSPLQKASQTKKTPWNYKQPRKIPLLASKNDKVTKIPNFNFKIVPINISEIPKDNKN